MNVQDAAITRRATLSDCIDARARITVLEGYIEVAAQERAEVLDRIRAIRSNIAVEYHTQSWQGMMKQVRHLEGTCERRGKLERDLEKFHEEIRALRALHAL